MVDVRIEESFELLSQEEWNEFLSVDIFDNMKITKDQLNISDDFFQYIKYEKLLEMLQEHNNKVGSLMIAYALCKHYYNKGIPDEPWYISPGKNGESIQYMPEFHEEHWMRRYWFNFFSDIYYLKISAIWDSIVEILNHYYGLDFIADLRLRDKVFKWLRTEKPEILNCFIDIQNNQLYKDAQTYRTAAAHGISVGSVQNMVKIKKDDFCDVFEPDENGNVQKKRVKAKLTVSTTVGEYTNVKTIMKNMEEYAKYTGERIKEICSLMISK